MPTSVLYVFENDGLGFGEYVRADLVLLQIGYRDLKDSYRGTTNSVNLGGFD